MTTLDKRGHEVVSGKPVEMPLGWKRPKPLNDRIREIIQRELSDAAAQHGAETWEESDDFDIGDDFDPRSPWELDADQAVEPIPKKVKTNANRQKQVEKPVGSGDSPAADAAGGGAIKEPGGGK